MIDNQGYRANVGIIIFNNNKKVLWAKRTNESAWQFPQGGIQQDELPEDAMYRELMEEVGLSQNHIQLIAKTKGWLYYDVPKCWINRVRDKKYKGQKQIWFLLRLIGNDKDIFLKNSNKPEFDDWKWVDFWLPIDQVIKFKREVYKKALKELSKFLDSS